jgi:proteasome lid subunit RPN8/RPN11
MKNQKIKIQRQEKPKLKFPAERRIHEQSQRLTIRFSPTAWAKLTFFRDKSDNEVGGFGITKPDDLLSVIDFITVKQEVTVVSVKFDDNAVADFFDEQVDLGRKPEQFARVWLHTHPGMSPEPSAKDEDTFSRVFGNCQWAVMFILAEGRKTYAKLSFNVGPGGQILIPVEIDYSQEFGPSNQEAWDVEYKNNIKANTLLSSFDRNSTKSDEPLVTDDFSSYSLPFDFIGELEKMEPAERQFILDELAERPELWDEESEVMYL